MALVSKMRGTPPTHVVRMRTTPTVGPKPPLLSRPRVTAGLAVGVRARVLILLSTACPTSLASDQTKGGGRPGVQRTPRFGAREQRFDLTKIQLSSKLSPKDPKEFAKKFRDATGEPREKRLLQITNLKAALQRLHRLYIYHTEKRSGRATPEIFLTP